MIGTKVADYQIVEKLGSGTSGHSGGSQHPHTGRRAAMRRRVRTSRPHERSFEHAPRVLANDTVRWTRTDDTNPGWFFGTDPSGLEGYFPQRWFELDRSTSTARALRDYDAAELTIEAGVDVERLETESGWVFVRTRSGEQGWIPADCVI